jgi:Fic-DOC domain mobile mystery protein B
MSLITEGDGNTPLTEEEMADLIPDLATKQDLNEWERENILRARTWADDDRTILFDIVTDKFVRKLHSKMFDDTWKWAGEYRKTEKNLGVPVGQIREKLSVLFGDARYWIENKTYPAQEVAIRFHHRLVAIHAFPNGNGRHSRLIADILLEKQSFPPLGWGDKSLVKDGTARENYIQALRDADNGNIQPLLDFAHS